MVSLPRRRDDALDDLRKDDVPHRLLIRKAKNLGAFILALADRLDAASEYFSEVCSIVRYESQDGRREIIDLDIQHQRKAIVNEHDLQHQRRASHDVDVHGGQTAEKPHLRDADHGEKYTDWQ